LDFLALFPFREAGAEEAGYYLRLSRLLKLTSIFNIANHAGIDLLVNKIKSKMSHRASISLDIRVRTVGSFFQVILVVVFFAYTLACVWQWYIELVDDLEYSHETYNDFHDKIRYKDATGRLLVTFYFMVTTLTTIGYGDLYPVNIYEYTLMIFIMLVGIAMFSYVIGAVHSAMASLDEFESTQES
jgi:Trk-type K+ transport system membrane component